MSAFRLSRALGGGRPFRRLWCAATVLSDGGGRLSDEILTGRQAATAAQGPRSYSRVSALAVPALGSEHPESLHLVSGGGSVCK